VAILPIELEAMITSNHVHLLAWVSDGDAVSAAVQYVHGTIGQAYNRRKGRSGAFWSGRFHPTLIENGPHLSRCLFYIGLNMVRARAVSHPSDWGDCGVHELLGEAPVPGVLNLERLLQCLEMPGDLSGFRRWYGQTLDELSAGGYLIREPMWTECVAVGSRRWVQSLSHGLVVGRREVCALPHSRSAEVALGEAEASYGLHASRRSADAILL